jgi:hypothetical protein
VHFQTMMYDQLADRRTKLDYTKSIYSQSAFYSPYQIEFENTRAVVVRVVFQ